MKKIYYLFSFAFVFMSLHHGLAQTGCSDLEITAVENGSVCGGGSVTLQATASGTGDEIVWYDSATGGSYLSVGDVFETPSINSPTSYWVAEVIGVGGFSSGHGLVAPISGANFGTAANYGLLFDVHQPFTLSTVDVYTSSASGDNIEVTIFDENLNVLHVVNEAVPPGNGTVPYAVPINFTFVPGNNYRISRTSTGGSYKYESSNANTIGYPLIVGNAGATMATIKAGAYGTTIPPGGGDHLYYIFYNWTIDDMDILCESPREEVIATVNNVADEDIASLPYSHTENTATYFNNYSGAPGSDCGSNDDYLDGYDVVYKYTADDDYILNVELTDLDEVNTAIFVYEDCADIGDTCAVEGSINDTNTADHGFQMLVEDGKDYYFVVSSAEPTDSFNYTLKIDGNTCANYPAPTGVASQDFVDGQKLFDLDVTGINLTWYSDSALSNEIDEDTEMVDNTTYYVTQTFDTCESSALAITVNEISCSVLDVAATEDGEVCGEGMVWLSAEGAEALTGTDIYWYDNATGGKIVGKGNDFKTDVLEQTTSFWAAEVALSGGGKITGQAETNPPALTNGTTNNYGLLFEVSEAFTLESVTVLNTAAAGGEIQVDIRDVNDNNDVVFTTKVAIPGGGTTTSPVPVVVPVNHELPVGDYRILRVTSGSTVGLGYMSATNSNFPYILGDNLGKITSGSLSASTSITYYNFFDWTISSDEIICESDRVEVIAEVNEVADEIVDEPLPYSHTANTKDYGNNYFGVPGTDCIAESYLDGNDVVYQFSPSVGAVYSIELSGLSSNNAGVFVYESCYDIGVSCVAGAVSDGTTADFGIDEVALNDGQDYFIVISTKTSSSTAYTITIDEAQIDCADYKDAPIGEEEQIVDIGTILDDLNVKGANLSWYSDSSLSTVLQGTTVIVDEETYYVTQTLNGCESAYLRVKVYELDCSALEIVSTQDATVVCKGSVTLNAVGSGGMGTDLFWYESETATEHVYKGASFTIPEINTTTSYWVAEAAFEGGEITGQAKEEPSSTATTSLSSYGLQFDVTEEFVLASVDVYPTTAGVMDLELRDASGTVLETITGINVPAGDGQTPHTIQLDLTIPVGQGLRLLKTNSTPSMVRDSSGNSFPYPIGDFGEITGGALNQGSSTSYYWFYNWTIGSEEIICESPRVEVEVEVTPDANEIIGSLPYSHSENTGTYGNIYGGSPGDNCGITESYLNGSSAVYTYTATDDDLITIELTDLDEYYAGVFIYESCSEIGEECLAGAVAGPSTDDVRIQDFPVEEGETYYIVVSSWLTNNIDYTLKVNSFSCSDLETPDGATTQQFVAGDTVDDLIAEATRVGAVLAWYEDVGLTQEIIDPSTHNLVDGNSYYITQTLNGCESDPLIITVEEIDCSDLEIVDYTEATVACRGSVTLKVEASGAGSQIYWYDVPTGGTRVGKGNTFDTPELTQTTSYWAAEAFVEGEEVTGQAKVTHTANTATSGSDWGLVFDATEAFVLTSVDVFSAGAGGNLVVELQDDTGGFLETATVSVPGGGTSTTPIQFTVPLDFNIPGPGTYRLIAKSTPTLLRDSSGNTYPYPIGGVGEVTSGYISGTSTSYYWFYNWTIGGEDVICESPRQEVVATIDQSGDIQLDYADLPYLDSNNTSNYGNNFSGDAGDGCDGANYLNGYEAMYYYEADPNNDDILTIELSNVNNPNAAVFIYDSCGEVGISCLNGATLENGIATIEDVYVEAGGQLLIVVSSMSGTVDYDLEIYGIDCNNLAAPTGEASPYFVAGDMVDDLEVDGSIYNQGFKWYNDAALTDEITDPTNEVIVDGTSYFVTQTILDCESAAFEIIPMEFECGLMGVTPQVEDIYVCAPGGEVTLKTTASGIGSEVFWYDAESEGNYLGKGTEMTFSVEQNTSFWATEVYIAGSVVEENQAETNPPALLNSTVNNGGLQFVVNETFTLENVTVLSTSAGGEIQVDIRDIDNNNDIVFTTKARIPGGGTTTNPIPVVIPIDFELNQGNYRILRVTSGTTVGLGYMSAANSSFPYTLGNNLGVITNGSVLSGTSTLYYSFFDWTIRTGDVICESTRTEYHVQLNYEVPNPPVVTPLQKICGDGLLSDILVLGENITWYGANGTKLNASSPIVEGQRYYVTQTVKGCESNTQEVIMDFNEKSEMPVAAVNQSFVIGEELQDITVDGVGLRWYNDKFKTEELAPNTKLVDQTTYYVTQEQEDFCESEPLGITVHETLDIIDQLFEYFEFYPNPVEDILYITNSETIEQIEIFDVAGRRVVERQFNQADLILNVEELSTGTYLLKAKVGGMEKVFRIIKK